MRLEVLSKYLGKGTDGERALLTSLLIEVDRGNRAAVKKIQKASGSMSGCDSWEAVCAQWLVDHEGQLANNLRGVDSIMLRMMQEIANPSPFAAEVTGKEEEEIDWNSDEFKAPPEDEKGATPPEVAAVQTVDAMLEGLLVEFRTWRALPADAEARTSPPSLLVFRDFLFQAASLVLETLPQEEAFSLLRELTQSAFQGAAPMLLKATVEGEPGTEDRALYIAFVGEGRFFRVMGFDLEAAARTAVETPDLKSWLDGWSDDELKAILKVRDTARREARKATPPKAAATPVEQAPVEQQGGGGAS